MLQQTRVATVLHYYEPFLRRFPTAAALAEAPLADVLKAWQGMGYYSRGRNLHAAARVLLAEHGGRLPQTAAELRRLPGIGAYTAAAIASIAFGQGAAVVDGNVARVLCRLLALDGDPRRPAVARQLQAAADSLLPGGKAGDFNQAMMDLGAMVCTPTRPDCPACPLGRRCRAAAAGRQADLPRKTPRRPVPHYHVAVAVISDRGRLLLDRRPDDAMLGGLWELPGGKPEAGETLDQAVVREVREEVGLDVESLGLLAKVDHAYSHLRVTLHAFRCRRIRGRTRAIGCAAVAWVPFARLSEYPIPAATRKVLRGIALTKRTSP
jgi:A/G-specific adenine glycosylase